MNTSLLSWEDICTLYAGETVVLSKIEADERGYIKKAKVVMHSEAEAYNDILRAAVWGIDDAQLVRVPPRENSGRIQGRVLGTID